MALTVDAEGMLEFLVARNEVFHFDEVDPAVAEVIFINERRIAEMVGIEISETNFCRLECRAFVLKALVELGRTIDQAADDELMQVRIGPGESGLDDLVELSQIKVERKQDAAPDRRLDVLDGDLGLHDQLLVEIHGGHNADGRRRRQLPTANGVARDNYPLVAACCAAMAVRRR